MEDYEQRKVGEKEMEGSLCDHMFPAQMRGAWVSSMLTLVMAMCIMPSPRAVGEYIERHWESLKKYCPPNLDKKYFVNEAKEVGNEDWEASPMLIEVICRLKNFQLMVHLIGTGGRSWMFGGRGPVRQAIKSSLGYAPLRFPQSERFAEKERWTTEAQQVTPVIVITPPTPPPVPRIIVTPPTPTASPPPQAPRYNLRSNTANVPVPNVPEERRTRSRPAPFRPANIEHLAPEYAIELAAPTTPAYEIINDKIYCRLENCARPGAPFETAAAWMTHVRRGKCHSNNTLCTGCGYHIRMPYGLSLAQIQLRMQDHRQERCLRVSKKTIEARQVAVSRLRELGRDETHFVLPTTGAGEGVGMSRPLKRHLRSEADRRADECVAYLKRYKEDSPQLLERIVAEYQFRIN